MKLFSALARGRIMITHDFSFCCSVNDEAVLSINMHGYSC